MSFHTKYRPRNLERIIGHEAAVTRLRGMVTSGNIPSAIAFFGPTSAGKTTFSRALAAAINGLKDIGESRDYIEINASVDRSIDDIRQMQQTAKFRPQLKRRIICIDEAHGLLGNPVAGNAILKMLEDAPKNTTFIVCSMDPAKFQSTQLGRAIINRCSQIILSPHTPKDLLKQAYRIAKAEKMSYIMDDENKLLKMLVEGATEMRTTANLVEAAQQYYDGLEKKPKMLTKDDLSVVLASTENSDEVLAVEVMLAVYEGKFKIVQRSLLDIQESFTFVNKLLWANTYLLNTAALDGKRHPKVWPSKTAKELMAKAKGITLGTLAATNASLIEAKIQITQFAAPVEEVLSLRLYRLIKELYPK
jgi:DNA polymerase III gamma/tau subunit